MPLPKPKPFRQLSVLIDPGHGGADPGAIGQGGTFEKHVTLTIARALAQELDARGLGTVALTRADDSFLSLTDRVAMAEAMRADLMISVHADSAPSPAIRGLSVYTLSPIASDHLAQTIATQENSVDRLASAAIPIADKDTATIMVDLARRQNLNASLALKHALVRDLAGSAEMLEHPERSANFAVLRTLDVPALLIESGFLSNERDEARLSDPRHCQALGARIAEALSLCLTSHTLLT